MDYDQSPRDFIEQQFKENGISYDTLGGDFSVYCPFWPHSGEKKLLQVKFDGKKIHCWSCGAGGSYNKLAEKLNIKKLPPSIMNGYAAMETKITDAFLERGLPSLPLGMKPFNEPYRGLTPEFLAKFDSKKWWDVKSSIWRILWPITFNGKLQGYTAGRLDGEKRLKYVHGPDGVIQTRRVLWPIDYPEIRDTVVLVEGPFSALRLLNEGIPAVAILGAQNWHSAKITLMQQRKHPIRGVVIAFDADDAGDSGSDDVYESVKLRFERVERFDCPLVRYTDPTDGVKKVKGTDPGDMPASFVEKLRALVGDVSASLTSKKPKKSKKPTEEAHG